MSHKFITHSEDGDELYLKTPYNEEFRDKMKDLVDRDSRKWDSTAKHWIIDPGYEEELEKLVRDYWGSGTRKDPKRKTGRPYDPLRDTKRPPHSEKRASAYSPPDPIGSVDDYIDRIAKEDTSYVIKELTAKVGALTYELGQARTEAKTWLDRADRLNAQRLRDERTIVDLRYRLSIAESRQGATGDSMPFRGGRPLNGSGPYAVLHLAPDAPPEVVKAAQRALAMLHHPDRGGSEADMKRINNAADEILGK